MDESDLMVVSGDYCLSGNEDTEQVRPVLQIIVHPNFEAGAKEQKDDIAVLKVNYILLTIENMNPLLLKITFKE